MLCDKEEELVHVLSVKDPVEVANNLYRKCIISDTMRDQFVSLDHSRVEPQLQIRYLLRLARKQLEEDNTVWDKFLNLLTGMGASFNTMRVDLQKHLDKITAGVEVCHPTTPASEEADIILTIADAEDLTELLAEKCHKWEEIAMALRLPEPVREECRSINKDIIRLNKVITRWLSGNTNTLGTSGLCQFSPRICYLALPLFLPDYAQYYAQICQQNILYNSYYIVTLCMIQSSPLKNCLMVIIL